MTGTDIFIIVCTAFNIACIFWVRHSYKKMDKIMDELARLDKNIEENLDGMDNAINMLRGSDIHIPSQGQYQQGQDDAKKLDDTGDIDGTDMIGIINNN